MQGLGLRNYALIEIVDRQVVADTHRARAAHGGFGSFLPYADRQTQPYQLEIGQRGEVPKKQITHSTNISTWG
jgi:hypothetical protein